MKKNFKKNLVFRDIIIKPRISNWAIKFFIPDFLIGHPNLKDNLKILRKHPQFKPLRMALVAWLIFTMTAGSVGIYSLITAPKTFALDPECIVAPDDPAYVVCTYTSDGTFTAPASVSSVAVLVVAGGGGGGAAYGGGGGAGGLIYEPAFSVTPEQSYPVTVGAGGPGSPAIGQANRAENGDDSIFSTLTAVGGGGSVGYLPFNEPGSDGGSGGGGLLGGIGGSATEGQGHNGGTASAVAQYGGGGGGGAGAEGGTGGTSAGGIGGVGLPNSISGVEVYYAGGGGGSTWNSGTGGAGGNGGGGRGGDFNQAGNNGTVNTGGGGGGGGYSGSTYKGGDGGSGIIIIRYMTNQIPNTPTNSSPIDGATRQSITPTLTSSAFSDPDVGDTHLASQWQITTTSGNYTSPIYDSGTDATNKTSITIPGSTLAYATTYYWHVRHEDNNETWSSYSSETSFTTASQPAMPTNSSPTNGAIEQDTYLTLSASAFSDPDPGSSQTASQWQVRSISDPTYSSPVYDSGTDTSNLTSIAIPAGNLEKNTIYYWHVRYKDDLENWSAYSTETVFTTGLTPVTVVSIGATEYQSGEIAKLTVQIESADGTPINNATTTITIYNPSNTVVVDNLAMTYIADSNGLYYYDYTVPATEGVYTYQVKAVYLSNTSYSSHAFHISPALNTITDIDTNVNTANTNITTLDTKLNSLASNLDILIGAFIVTQSTVSDASPTATSFVTALTNSTNDFYKNAVLTFTSGNLNGQVRRISAYNGTTKTITLDPALTSAPEDDDAFTITKQNVRVEEQATQIKTVVDDTNTKVTDIQTKVTDIQTKVTAIQSDLTTINTNLGTLQSGVNTLRASQQKMYTLKLSDVSEIEPNSNYRSTLTVRDYEGNPIDLAEVPTIIIYNSLRAEALPETSMIKVAGTTGVYEYVYPVLSGAIAGLWESFVKIDTEGTEDNILNDYWQVTGSPAQVLVNSVTATSLDNVLADVTITNEGSSQFEYHYEYCIVDASDNACGGNDDIFHGTGSKLIGAGVYYNTAIPVPPGLPMSVPIAGTYYFKLIVYFGTEASGASLQFEATEGTLTPIVTDGGSRSSQVTTLETLYDEMKMMRQELQAESKKLTKTLTLIGNVDINSPGFKSLLDINTSNTEDIKGIQNRISDLRAVSSVAQKIIEQNSSAPIVETYMKFNSVEINFLITNPLKVAQTVKFSAFLPEEARPENILDSSGLKVEYDPNAKTYFVSGEINLGPKQTITKKIEMKDIWVFDEIELNLIKEQAISLVETLKKTQFESQGIILKGDIEATINMVISKQKASYSSPQDHIVIYRENKDRVTKIQNEFDQLKDLVSQANSSKGIIGNIGGIQTFATWGIILAIIFGFSLLSIIIFAMWRHQTKLAVREMRMNRREFDLLEEKRINGKSKI